MALAALAMAGALVWADRPLFALMGGGVGRFAALAMLVGGGLVVYAAVAQAVGAVDARGVLRLVRRR